MYIIVHSIIYIHMFSNIAVPCYAHAGCPSTGLYISVSIATAFCAPRCKPLRCSAKMQDLMDTAEKCCITAPALIFTSSLARIHRRSNGRAGC